MLDFSDPTSVVNMLGILVPLIVALISKRYASSGLKSVLNVVTSAVVSTLGYLVAASGDGYDLVGWLEAFIGTLIVSIAVYYGVLKPTNLTEAVNVKTARFGFGSPPDMEADVAA